MTVTTDLITITPAMMRAKVEKAERGNYPGGVIAMLGRTDGDVAGFTVGERPVLVRYAGSALMVREALLEHTEGDWMVIVTDRSDDDLGVGILAHFVGARLQHPDPWESVLDTFGATSLSSGLAGTPGGRDLASALLSAAPQDRKWLPAPAGVLTRSHAFACVARTHLGIDDDAPDLVTVLNWSTTSRAQDLLAQLRADYGDVLADATLDWLADRGGAARDVVRALLVQHLPQLVPLGMVLHLFTTTYATSEENHLAEMGLAKTEHLWKPVKASSTVLTTIGAAASTVIHDLARDKHQNAHLRPLLSTAESLLADADATELGIHSDLLPEGFRARLTRVAVALERDLADPTPSHHADVEEAWEAASQHRLGRHDATAEASAFGAAVRLSRWLRTEPLPDSASLTERVAHHIGDGSWADAAINDAYVGVDDPELSACLAAVVDRALARRDGQERAFARALAAETSADSSPTQTDGASPMWPLEDVLPQVVLPLARKAPARHDRPRGGLLLLVMDGMSAAAADEITLDTVNNHGWVEVGVTATTTHRAAGLAVLPSLTEVSRASLLSGRLVTGGQDVERRNYTALTAKLGKPAIFHKKSVDTTAAGALVARDVGAAIDDVENTPLVTVVLNTIDDALDRSDAAGITWTADAVKHLKPLLARARDVGRTVIITADHGHVVERRRGEQRSYPGISSARSRPVTSDVKDDEVIVSGPRVLTDGHRAVLAVSEALRYGPLKAGYHGGASAAEVVVPIISLIPDLETNPFALPALPPQQPAWWEADAAGAAPYEAPARTTRPVSGTVSKQAGPTLFDQEPAAGPAATTNVGQSVTSSLVYAQQRTIAGRIRISDEKVARLVSALDAAGGRLPRSQVAASLEVSELQLDGALAQLRQLLNVEGYPVIYLDPDRTTVRLDQALLREQYEVT